MKIEMTDSASHKHFAFFANASSTIGAGHFMRLFALAQACAKRCQASVVENGKAQTRVNISITFVSTQCPSYLQQKLNKEGFSFVELPSAFTLDDLSQLSAHVIFIDDYFLTAKHWQMFIDTGALLVNIDDNTHQEPLLSHVIVNPAANASVPLYRQRAANAVLCLGYDYTLLRQEFIQQAFIPIQQRQQILITLGASDVKNMSYVLALSLLEELTRSTQVCVLLGGLKNQAADKLESLAAQYHNLQLVQQSNSVAQLMMHSGLAITAAGNTLSELASMGTPSIALVSVDNQQAALEPLPTNTWFTAIDVREFEPNITVDSQEPLDQATANKLMVDQITEQAMQLWRDLCKREQMSNQARQLIDGKGCARIVEQVLMMHSTC
jgi:spore coat polysaccharide biosynthesis predicted glycosyltransferase SpsG